MACSKAHRFDPIAYHFSIVHYALSHPAREIMLEKLLSMDECSFKHLRAGIPLQQNTVSQHLRMLRDSQLVRIREEPPDTYYRLNRDMPFTCAILEQMMELQRQYSDQAAMIDELRSMARVRGISINDRRLGDSEYIVDIR
ncbi:MAG: winged helix-turn-helix domain-containing protein [Saprospiraceae bacterium]|nr:winged helix-turn-helix domain-containing protein [Saprospiraceae bacterium]